VSPRPASSSRSTDRPGDVDLARRGLPARTASVGSGSSTTRATPASRRSRPSHPRRLDNPSRLPAAPHAAFPGHAADDRVRRHIPPLLHACARCAPTRDRGSPRPGADAGVDDVVLIAALALHRRMTDPELRHALGDRVFEAFAPHGLLMQHDAEDPSNLVDLGVTDHGEDVEINRRAAESDLLIYVNINLSAMDGGTSRCDGARLLQEHQTPPQRAHDAEQPLVHGQAPFRASQLELADGRFIAESGVKLFQIETTLNTDTFPKELAFLQKREWSVTQGPRQFPCNLDRSRADSGG